MIVFDDADLKNAVKGALMANFFTQVGRTQKDAFFDANGTNNKSIQSTTRTTEFFVVGKMSAILVGFVILVAKF